MPSFEMPLIIQTRKVEWLMILSGILGRCAYLFTSSCKLCMGFVTWLIVGGFTSGLRCIGVLIMDGMVRRYYKVLIIPKE